MRKSVRSFLLLGSILASTAFGSQFVLANDAAPAPAQGELSRQFHGNYQGLGMHRRQHSFRRLAKALNLPLSRNPK
jgi:hypothetical protein